MQGGGRLPRRSPEQAGGSAQSSAQSAAREARTAVAASCSQTTAPSRGPLHASKRAKGCDARSCADRSTGGATIRSWCGGTRRRGHRMQRSSTVPPNGRTNRDAPHATGMRARWSLRASAGVRQVARSRKLDQKAAEAERGGGKRGGGKRGGGKEGMGGRGEGWGMPRIETEASAGACVGPCRPMSAST